MKCSEISFTIYTIRHHFYKFDIKYINSMQVFFFVDLNMLYYCCIFTWSQGSNCLCIYEYYVIKSYDSFFFFTLRVHPGIRHGQKTMVDDSVRACKLNFMYICPEQRISWMEFVIFFSTENKKLSVLIFLHNLEDI